MRMEDRTLGAVLREATELEQTPGLIRPITANMCGLIIGRFAESTSFRSGSFIRDFLRDSVRLPEIRDLSPKIIPNMISSHITKYPRSIPELSQKSGLSETDVRSCLWTLGQADCGIVRPLDTEQEIWEISHDFLVPLLDSIFSRWSSSLWQRGQPWLLWTTVCLIGVLILASAVRTPNSNEKRLRDLGWAVVSDKSGADKPYLISYDRAGPAPYSSSRGDLKRLQRPIRMTMARPLNGIEALRDVENLRELDILNTRDIAPLENFTNLTRLGISNVRSRTGNVDLAPINTLKTLKNLKELDLEGIFIPDLAVLEELPNLQILRISGSSVDLSKIAALQNLVELTIDYPQSQNCDVLANLKNLQKLDVSAVDRRDTGPHDDFVACVGKLSKLTDLKFDNAVSDLGPIANLTNLTVLQLTAGPLADLKPLAGLSQLTDLDLDLDFDSKKTDLTPLSGLTKLVSLDISANPTLISVEPVKNLTNLKRLKLSFTSISDLTPLIGLRNLEFLMIDNNRQLRNLAPLRNLVELKTLYLDLDGNISDLTALSNLQKLSELNLLGDSKVTNLSPLRSLSNLTDCYLDEEWQSSKDPIVQELASRGVRLSM
jgi:hypothetical protein